jgi:Protein of unknown function (DUF1552)
MMLSNRTIDRRTILKGLGTALALPFLDAMRPRLAVAGTGGARQALPVRFACVYVPNGKHMPEWTPSAEGKLESLPSILEPLAPVRDYVSVLTNLTCDKARPNGDGPGDHARAMSAFLTGAQPRKTHGADIRAGISFDQYLAHKIGDATRFPSLEIGCEASRTAGNCDSGYSCVYNSTVSWRTESTPVPKEINPRQVFERLFGNNKPDEAVAAREKRERYRKSIIDMVRDDANALQGTLGSADNRKLDEYLSAIREVERRIERAAAEAASPRTAPAGAAPPNPGVPKDFTDHVRLMNDLLVLAFRSDATRVITHVFANESSGRGYPGIGVPEGHHDLSHHGRDPKKQEKIRLINRFHVSLFGELLAKLRDVPEGEGTLLDRCLIVYGSGNSDGNAHNHDNLPILLAGRGGGVLSGRHVRYPRETPLTNLFVAIAERLGAETARFGDSTGKLANLS